MSQNLTRRSVPREEILSSQTREEEPLSIRFRLRLTPKQYNELRTKEEVRVQRESRSLPVKMVPPIKPLRNSSISPSRERASPNSEARKSSNTNSRMVEVANSEAERPSARRPNRSSIEKETNSTNSSVQTHRTSSGRDEVANREVREGTTDKRPGRFIRGNEENPSERPPSRMDRLANAEIKEGVDKRPGRFIRVDKLNSPTPSQEESFSGRRTNRNSRESSPTPSQKGSFNSRRINRNSRESSPTPVSGRAFKVEGNLLLQEENLPLNNGVSLSSVDNMVMNLAPNEVVGSQVFGKDNFFVLSDGLSYGEYLNSLYTEMQKAASNRKISCIKLAINLNYPVLNRDKFEKMVVSFLREDLPTEPTEEQSFYLALLPLFSPILASFLEKKGVRNIKTEASDRYFWLILRTTGMANPSLEVEMERRGVSKAKLLNIPRNNYLFVHEDTNRIPSMNAEILGKLGMQESARLYSLNEDENRSYMNRSSPLDLNRISEFYGKRILTFCEDVLRMGAVIAGGFVNSIVNPAYHTVKIPINKNFLEDEQRRSPGEGEGIIVGKKAPERAALIIVSGAKYKTRDSLSPYVIKLNEIEGYYDFIRAFYSHYPPHKISEEESKTLEEWKKSSPKGYDLKSESRRLKEYYFAPTNGHVWFTLPIITNDIDIFFTGPDYLSKAKDVADYLIKIGFKYMEADAFFFSEFATSLGSGFKRAMKIQLIKRAYNDVSEILTGFDIDSSRVALVWEDEKMNVLTVQAYIQAVKYGINMIVPSRQSQTFNSRLDKYRKRGYEPYVSQAFSIDENGDVLRHTLSELRAHMGEKSYKWNLKNYSDYEELLIGEDPAYQILLDQKESGAKTLNENLNELLFGLLKNKTTLSSATRKDIMFLALLVGRYYRFEKNIVKFTQIVNYASSLFWRVVQPGTQFTGSFNPTHMDYLGSSYAKDSSVVEYKEEKEDLGGYFDEVLRILDEDRNSAIEKIGRFTSIDDYEEEEESEEEHGEELETNFD